MVSQMRILFILKKRDSPYSQERTTGKDYSYNSFSSGLYNSVRFIVDMLFTLNIDVKMVEVPDNNSINKEVITFKPTHVIIEALWVVPEKFDILKKIHPTVKWHVRLHSEMTFIANEGVAMGWILQYAKRGIKILANSKRMCDNLNLLFKATNINQYVEYTPNYYKVDGILNKPMMAYNALNIASFGAIRSLKNQLIQAQAAIIFASRERKKLYFHINANRIENESNSVLKNIRDLFSNLDSWKFELVEHNWLDHKSFLEVVRKMDMGLQLSLSETFNIVTADFVSQNVPVVVSDEIDWVSNYSKSDTMNLNEIVLKMANVYQNKKVVAKNIKGLEDYNNKSIKEWSKFCGIKGLSLFDKLFNKIIS
jgi:hypothetical protein